MAHEEASAGNRIAAVQQCKSSEVTSPAVELRSELMQSLSALRCLLH